MVLALWRSAEAISLKPYGKEAHMLHYAVLFFIVAVVAALLGMRGVAGLSAEIGYVLVVVAVIFLVIAFLTGRGAVPPIG